MATSAQAGAQPSGLVEISRAVVSAAAELVGSLERAMIGEAKIRTARGNAFDAMCEDRARARARDEMEQLVRTLMAGGRQAAAQVHRSQPAAHGHDSQPVGHVHGSRSFAARAEGVGSMPAHAAGGPRRLAELASSSR